MLATGEALTEENLSKRAAAYWSAQGFDEEGIYYIGDSHRATYPTMGQDRYDGLGGLANSPYRKAIWAHLKAGQVLLSGVGDTVAGAEKGGASVGRSEISARILQVGVPSDATSLQMYHVQRTVDYAKHIGVTVKIIRVN